jgi:FemAB-related protein (PEP-CTERM system-associated)
MVKIRQVEIKDQVRWDEYVLSHSESTPYHLWAWKESIEQAYGHKAYYFWAEDDGQVVGILPLFNLRFPLLLNELTALPFCDVGNLLAGSLNVQNLLIKKVKEFAKDIGPSKSSFRGILQYSDSPDSDLYIEVTGKVRMLLSMPNSSEALLAGFKSKLRSQIRKAEKNGVQFYWAGLEGVDDFYAVYCRNMRDLGSPPHSRQWFISIMTNFKERARIGLAKQQGKCIGAGLILLTDTSTVIPWASTLREYNRLSPNMLLYWNFLKFSSDNGFLNFDFGRSTEGEGTYRFKKQWGALPIPLTWYSLHKNGHKRDIPKEKKIDTRTIVASTWKKLPFPVASFIGPHLRKYISL